MKYMHSEWRRRLEHWIDTLKKDLYHPLGAIRAEAFFTMEHLTPEDAATQAFAPIAPGTPWGKTWEYCWLRSSIILPPEAAGKRVVMDLRTGGETTVFVDGKSFGTYRADWVDVPHHYIVDNCLTPCGEAGRGYDLLLEAYAGHYYPHSEALGGCCTGPVLPGSYADPKEGKLRAVLGDMTYGVWNEDAYQLYMDLHTLNLLIDQVDPGHCPSFSAFRVDAENVFIDTVKPAEDGSGDIILRLYEAKRADTVCHVTLNIPAASVCLCDLLENAGESLDPRHIALRFHPFEVKTLRITPVQ